jgi:penicillin-insensitive murein DD-endopeptidase
MLRGPAAIVLAGVAAAVASAAGVARGSGPALSIGSPTSGELLGGVALAPTPYLDLRWPDGPRWALPTLVRMLDRAAQRVGKRYPGSVLLVGELSKEGGGDLVGHASHESGRDADVGFYYRTAQGKPVRARRLMRVEANGRVPGESHVMFDEARNWALVEAFLTDPEVVVQRIFVATGIRERLLDHGRLTRATPRVIARAEAALHQPRSGPAHDDHFHVRIACPRGQQDVCIPTPLRRDVRADGAARPRSDG